MQFRHPESYRILSDGQILQDPMESGVGYVDLGLFYKFSVRHEMNFDNVHDLFVSSYVY